MDLQAKHRLLLSAKPNLNKLDFSKDPSAEFEAAFRRTYANKPVDGIQKLWILRRAVKQVIDSPQYKKWMKKFDELQGELE